MLSFEIRALTALRRSDYLNPLMLRHFVRPSGAPVALFGVGTKMCQTPAFLSQLLLNLAIDCHVVSDIHALLIQECTRVPADITCDAIRPLGEQMHNETNFEPLLSCPRSMIQTGPRQLKQWRNICILLQESAIFL